MKIGYFVTHFPYRTFPEAVKFPIIFGGGVANIAYNLAVQMAQRGHEVSVFTSSLSSHDINEEYDGLSVYRYGTWFRIEGGFVSPNLIRKPLCHEFDVLHLHLSVPTADIASLLYARVKKVPLIVTYHGDSVVGYGRPLRRLGMFLNNLFLHDQVLSAAKVIVSGSEAFVNESRSLPKYRNKVIVIPNGISVDQFSLSKTKEECRRRLGISSNAKVILFVGALQKYKAPDVLIKAIEKVAQQIENVELIIVGDGVMRNELQHLAEKLGVKDLVKFKGFINDNNFKTDFYKAADIFVLPSVMGPELFPIVLLEASAMGLPLLVSDLPQLEEFVENRVNGLVAKKGNDADLAAAIIELIANEELREHLGQNAMKKIAHLSWESIAQQYERLYEEILR